MNLDWAADVRKYAPDADSGVIAEIIRYCQVPLRDRGPVRVPFGDLAETTLLRENFLKRTLGLSLSDYELDYAIAQVRRRVRDVLRNRVTVYYLLAERFDRLYVFTPQRAAPVYAEPAYVEPIYAETPYAEPVTTDEPVWVEATTASEFPTARPIPAHDVYDEPVEAERHNRGWLVWLLLGLLLLVLLAWLVAMLPRLGQVAASAPDLPTASASADADSPASFSASPSATPSVAASTAPATAPAPTGPATTGPATTAPAPVAIPEGAGVISASRDGKPWVKVYFRSGSAWLVPAFRPAVQNLKAYVASHPGTTLTVSGFADKWGSAAVNDAMAAERAKRVKAALVAAGVADGSVMLVKPADIIDGRANDGSGRRVEVGVK